MLLKHNFRLLICPPRICLQAMLDCQQVAQFQTVCQFILVLRALMRILKS